MQETEGFLPVEPSYVVPPCRELLADILRVYAPSAPIAIRMAVILDQLEEQERCNQRFELELFPDPFHPQTKRLQSLLFTSFNYVPKLFQSSTSIDE